MKERINWIDWAKAMAVCTVVFCHLPQSQEWFYYRYLQTVIITIFFWVSGYLKKDHGSDKENWRKYWNGLIIPYLLYNAIVYPYWLAKYYMQNGGMPDLFHALRPVFGTLLLEHENSFCEPLNGPLWYLPAILLMHITLDLCRKTKYPHLLMTIVCIASFFIYGLNNKYLFMPNLTPIGFLRGLPFYYIGYLMNRTRGAVPSVSSAANDRGTVPLVRFAALLALSLLFFHWHLQSFHAGEHWLHIALFYPVNLCFLFSILYLSKLLDTYRLKLITNLSIGTLVIIGLHAPAITLFNFIFEHALHIQGVICYHWYEALPVALMIVALLYPVILFAQERAPILLGRKKQIKFGSSRYNS